MCTASTASSSLISPKGSVKDEIINLIRKFKADVYFTFISSTAEQETREEPKNGEPSRNSAVIFETKIAVGGGKKKACELSGNTLRRHLKPHRTVGQKPVEPKNERECKRKGRK